MISPSICIRNTPKKGKGVFATMFLPAGTLIEESPVIIMTHADRQLLDQTKLHDYIFEWEGIRDEEGNPGCCVALGYLSIYNHSYQSNCEYYMDYESEMMMIKTVRNIEPDEEVTINYNGDWNDPKKVWFPTEIEEG